MKEMEEGEEKDASLPQSPLPSPPNSENIKFNVGVTKSTSIQVIRKKLYVTTKPVN